MAMEVLVTKLIGPYFGASLYVWAATIGTTLIGLAAGYYIAGILSEKEDLNKKLLQISIVTGVYILILPFFSGFIMDLLITAEVKTGIILSTFIFNLPLFILFGLYSPIIIELLSNSLEDTAEYSGKIYGLSTLSGVLFLLIVGLYCLPYTGAITTVYLCGIILLLAAGIQALYLRNIEK